MLPPPLARPTVHIHISLELAATCTVTRASAPARSLVASSQLRQRNLRMFRKLSKTIITITHMTVDTKDHVQGFQTPLQHRCKLKHR